MFSMLEISFKKRAPRAVRVVRQFAAKVMLTTDVPWKKHGACFHGRCIKLTDDAQGHFTGGHFWHPFLREMLRDPNPAYLLLVEDCSHEDMFQN